MSDEAPRESLWRRWVLKPILNQLSQGTDPSKIAQAIAFGVTVGVFPLLGCTILMSLLFGVPLKLNQPILQVFREIVYPIHLATILLFIRAGEHLFGVEHTPLALSEMVKDFYASPSKFMANFGMLGVYAISVWALMAPVLLAIIYYSSKPLIVRLAQRFGSRPPVQ